MYRPDLSLVKFVMVMLLHKQSLTIKNTSSAHQMCYMDLSLNAWSLVLPETRLVFCHNCCFSCFNKIRWLSPFSPFMGNQSKRELSTACCLHAKQMQTRVPSLAITPSLLTGCHIVLMKAVPLPTPSPEGRWEEKIPDYSAVINISFGVCNVIILQKTRFQELQRAEGCQKGKHQSGKKRVYLKYSRKT